MSPEMLNALLSAIPATLLALAALITSVRASNKLADASAQTTSAQLAASTLAAAAAQALIVAAAKIDKD